MVDVNEAEKLLRRLRAWDHLPLTADGPYWQREIDRVLGDEPYYKPIDEGWPYYAGPRPPADGQAG